jgi:hypothetical protein
LESSVDKLIIQNAFLMNKDLEFSDTILKEVKEIKFCFDVKHEFWWENLVLIKFENLKKKFLNLKKIKYHKLKLSTCPIDIFHQLVQNNASITSIKSDGGYIITYNTTVYYAKDGKLQAFKCHELHTHILIAFKVSKDFILLTANDWLNFADIYPSQVEINQKELDFYNENKEKMDSILMFFVANRDITEVNICKLQWRKFFEFNLQNTYKINITIDNDFSSILLRKLNEKMGEFFEHIWHKSFLDHSIEASLNIAISKTRMEVVEHAECIKNILSLPFTSVNLLTKFNKCEKNIERIRECIVEPLMNNVHLKDFRCENLQFQWISNLDLRTPDEDDKELLENCLNSVMNFDDPITLKIKNRIASNHKYRLKVNNIYN